MKTTCAAIAVGVALIVGGCSDSTTVPEQPAKNQLSDTEHGKIPALLVDRWADCFDGLNEGSIARDGDSNRYTALVGDQMYSWRVGKGNTGDILTFTEDETTDLADGCY